MIQIAFLLYHYTMISIISLNPLQMQPESMGTEGGRGVKNLCEDNPNIGVVH